MAVIYISYLKSSTYIVHMIDCLLIYLRRSTSNLQEDQSNFRGFRTRDCRISELAVVVNIGCTRTKNKTIKVNLQIRWCSAILHIDAYLSEINSCGARVRGRMSRTEKYSIMASEAFRTKLRLKVLKLNLKPKTYHDKISSEYIEMYQI